MLRALVHTLLKRLQAAARRGTELQMKMDKKIHSHTLDGAADT
jgi:hypothetical protein